MDEALRNKIEAVLFSLGKKIHIDEILRMVKEKDKSKVVACLLELKKRYNDDENKSLMILQDGDIWKLTIKDQYIDVAKEIGIETELTKTVMETLAVIAYKNPVLQSDVIKVRTNKAYDHLKELEETGYIQRERYGRTRKIKLTQKFFDYFDLPPDSLKEKFKNVEDMEKVIEDKEKQIHEINNKKAEMIEQQKMDEKKEEKRNVFIEGKGEVKEIIEHKDNGLEVIEGERLGELDVFDEESQEDKEAKEEEKKKAEKEKEKEFLQETGEKVGEFDVYKEPEKFIEPGLEYEKDKKDEEQKEELEDEKEELMEKDKIDHDMDAIQKEGGEEDSISDIMDMKDKINQENKEEENKEIEEKKEGGEEGKEEDSKSEIKDEKKEKNKESVEKSEEGIADNNNNNNNEEKDNTTDEKSSEGDNNEKDESIPEEKKEEIEEKKEGKEEGKEEDSENKEDDMFGNRNMDGEGSEANDKLQAAIEATDLDKDNDENDMKEDDRLNDEELDYTEKEEETEENKAKVKLKEEELFNMKGIPKEVMEKIEEKAGDIVGEEGKQEDNEEQDF